MVGRRQEREREGCLAHAVTPNSLTRTLGYQANNIMPTHILESEEQVQLLRASVREAVERAAATMRELLENQSAMVALARMKFEELGFHPLEERRLNLIEQVNQTFTYLVSLAAAEDILIRHPSSAPLHLNLGISSGHDLISPSQSVVAEVLQQCGELTIASSSRMSLRLTALRRDINIFSSTVLMRRRVSRILSAFRKYS